MVDHKNGCANRLAPHTFHRLQESDEGKKIKKLIVLESRFKIKKKYLFQDGSKTVDVLFAVFSYCNTGRCL